MKIPQELQEYALFCAIDRSSDAYYDMSRLLLKGSINIPKRWRKYQIVYDRDLNVISFCGKKEVSSIMKDYPDAHCMQVDKFLVKFKKPLIEKHG